MEDKHKFLDWLAWVWSTIRQAWNTAYDWAVDLLHGFSKQFSWDWDPEVVHALLVLGILFLSSAAIMLMPRHITWFKELREVLREWRTWRKLQRETFRRRGMSRQERTNLEKNLVAKILSEGLAKERRKGKISQKSVDTWLTMFAIKHGMTALLPRKMNKKELKENINYRLTNWYNHKPEIPGQKPVEVKAKPTSWAERAKTA